MEPVPEFTPSAGARQPAVEPPSFRRLVQALAQAIDREIPPGDAAALRRLDPNDPSAPAFWRLLMAYVPPAGALGRDRERDDVERAWATIMGAMAHLTGLMQPDRSLGDALAAAGYSELRLARLLRAQGRALRDAVIGVARYLAAKAEPVDPYDLAVLLLSDGRADAESVRRRIARAYYHHQPD